MRTEHIGSTRRSSPNCRYKKKMGYFVARQSTSCERLSLCSSLLYCNYEAIKVLNRRNYFDDYHMLSFWRRSRIVPFQKENCFTTFLVAEQLVYWLGRNNVSGADSLRFHPASCNIDTVKCALITIMFVSCDLLLWKWKLATKLANKTCEQNFWKTKVHKK